MQRLIIAKYTLIEAHKRSLIALFLLGMGFCLALAAYGASLAMMQKQATLAAFYGASVRFMCVVLLGGYVILTETRNLEQENAFIWLGLPISRHSYLLQKIFTYTLLAASSVVLISLPLFWAGVEPAVTVRWCLGLYCELLVVISIAVLFSCLFRQPLISLSAFAAVYLFARSALGFYHHSNNIISGGNGSAGAVMAWVVKLCTYLVPKLELFATSSWLLHREVAQANWTSLLVQTLLFSMLLLVIALERLRARAF